MRLRPLSVTAGLALAAATLVAVPSPAQAAAITTATSNSGRFLNVTGPGTCNPTNPSSNSGSVFTSDGVTVTTSASGVSNLQDTGDPGDTMTASNSVTGKVRATESAGQLRTVSVVATQIASVTAAQGAGTDCDVNLSGTTQYQFQTVLTASRWMTIDAELPRGSSLQMQYQRTLPVSPPFSEIVLLVGNAKGRAHVELFLPAGTYTFVGVVNNGFNSPQVLGDPTSQTVTASIDITLDEVGTAKNDATGDGTKYLKVKNGLKCATGKLQGKFKSAAGAGDTAKIKKAIFKVNGAKEKVVTKPEKNDKVKLTGLPTSDDVSLEVVLKLLGGGSATLTRDYRSCT